MLCRRGLNAASAAYEPFKKVGASFYVVRAFVFFLRPEKEKACSFQYPRDLVRGCYRHEGRGRKPGLVFPPVFEVSFIHLDVEFYRSVRRACAPVMNGPGIRAPQELPAVIMEPFAPIRVLGIKKEAFIKNAELIYSFTARHEKTPEIGRASCRERV